MTGAALVLAVVCPISVAAAEPLPEAWAPLVQADYCRIDPAPGVPGLEAARSQYAANRPRDAAALAIAVFRQATTPAQSLSAALLAARALKVMGCDDAAMAVLDAALVATGPSPAHCLASSRRARLAATRDQAEAERRATAVLDCAATAGADDAASEAHATLALVALGRSDYAAAARQAARALERAASPLAQAEALRLRGNIAERRALAVEAARRDYDASLQAALAAADPEAQALARIERGNAFDAAQAGTDEATERIAAQGIDQAENGGLRRALAYGSYREGVHLAQQRTGRALARGARRLAQAAALSAAVGDQGLERAMRIELSSARLLLGDYAGARTAALRARDLALAAGLTREAAKSDQVLGMLARLADPPDLAAAEAALQRALAGLRAGGDDPIDVARVLRELAAVAMARGQPELAAALLDEALASSARDAYAVDTDMLLASQGWAQWQAGRPAQAQAAWRAALRSAQPQPRALAWWGLARLALATHPRVALARFALAAAEVERMRPASGDVDPTARSAFDRRFSSLYREYAALLVDLHQYPQAHRMALLTQRQELVEAHWSGERGTGNTAAPAQPALPEPLDACPPALMLREQALQVQQAELWRLRTPQRHGCCRDDDAQPLPDAACTADAEVTRYCALRLALRVEQNAVKHAQDDCMAQVRAAGAERSDALFPLDDDFEDAWVKAVDDQPVHLVVTIVEDQRLRVLLRSPGASAYRVATIDVPMTRLKQLAGALADAWDEARRLKSAGPPQALARAEARLHEGPLRDLHELLLGRFDPPALPAALPAGTTVAFVLDRVLRELPVAALHDGQRYLGERVATVRLTPSATAAAPAAAQGASLVLGVSKPDLPYVESEVTQVARMLDTTAFLNEQSTRRRVVDWLEELRPGRRALALHLASHATLGGTKASAEVHLWGPDPLTGLDLEELRTNLARVRLVVFSACRSAADGGELALGLAGLAERGARSVLGSLWNVDDASTATLMASFYAAWRRAPEAGVAQALALAQRQMLADGRYTHPYFWAPFGVVGRWD